MKFFLLTLCISAPLLAQHVHPSSGLGEKPVALYAGMGAWHHPIATANPEAQKFFDQGLVLVYGFNRYEALRSFRKVAELDPNAAMAYWGMAMALGPYINMDMDPSFDIKQSCEAVRQGLALQQIKAVERDWLETTAARCPSFSDPAAYIAAARSLAARLPDDPDAQTFYAEALMVPIRWHWYDAQGRPAEGELEAERVLGSVLRQYPTHPGANHLYIHAVESSPEPQRAIPSAERLMGIVPGAGHLVHMPGHIWLVLGEYNYAADVNERAVQVDREYFQKTGVIGTYYPYYLHNLSFILYARAMQGRTKEAVEAERQMAEAIAPVEKTMPEMAAAFGFMTVTADLLLSRWDQLLTVPKPEAADVTALAFWRYSRGIALAGKSDLAGAQKERSDFESLRGKVNRAAPWGSNKLGEIIDLAAVVFEARVASSPKESIPLWRRAVELQDSLAYDEPPGWYYPIRQSLGGALLRSGDAAKAEAVFREGLRRSPRNGRILFGLLESLRAQGKTDDAGWVRREFEEAWRGAGQQLRLEEL